MKPIRTGLINCDVHGTYYGALMQKHDPLAYADPKIGLGCHFYHYTMWDDPTRITVPTVWEFEITKLWDKDRERAEATSKMFFGKPRVCASFEDASNDVDLVFIADCSGEGSDHLRLASPGIKKRVPTFIDKPFAYDVAHARRMVDLANENHVPIMSHSMLKIIPHAARFKNRFAELDGPKFGTVRGCMLGLNGLIHAISLAVHLFGDGVESVEAMGEAPQVFVKLDYGKKPDRPPCGVVLNCDNGPTYHCSMYASAYSERGAIHSPNIGDYEFPWGAAAILEKVRDMVRTGKPQVPYDEMIELIAIAAAIRLSLQRRARVNVKEAY